MQTHNDDAFLKKNLLSFVTVLYVRHYPRNSGGIIVMTMSVLRFHFRIYWTESEIRSSSILTGWYRIPPPRIYIAIQLSLEPPFVLHSSVPASPHMCQSCTRSGMATCSARRTAAGKSRAGPGTCVAQSPSAPLLNSSKHFHCLVPSL